MFYLSTDNSAFRNILKSVILTVTYLQNSSAILATLIVVDIFCTEKPIGLLFCKTGHVLVTSLRAKAPVYSNIKHL